MSGALSSDGSKLYKVKVRHYPKPWDDTGKWIDTTVLLRSCKFDDTGDMAVEVALGGPFFGADPKRVCWVSIARVELPLVLS